MTSGKSGQPISRAWRFAPFRLAVVSLLLYATGGPSVLARNDNSQTFWIEQRQFDEQQRQQRAFPARPRPARPTARDYVPAEATRAKTGPDGKPIEASFFIDVIGDSLAAEVTGGLREAFADKPEIAVRGLARDSSGLVRDDFYDWIKTARAIAADKARVDYVVIEIGVNDLQTIRQDGQDFDPLSDRWRDLYGQRVEALVAAFRAVHAQVIWLGLPPMRSQRLNNDVAKLNELDKDHAEKAGARFADIWDAFADQNGGYDAFGPDSQGQNARLRNLDGIHYTKAGARKAAQFMENDIRRAFDSAQPSRNFADLPPDIEQAATDINAEIRREMGIAPRAGAAGQSSRPLAGPILSLTAKPMSRDGVLETRATAILASSLATGVEPDAERGRADDFAWPRPQ